MAVAEDVDDEVVDAPDQASVGMAEVLLHAVRVKTSRAAGPRARNRRLIPLPAHAASPTPAPRTVPRSGAPMTVRMPGGAHAINTPVGPAGQLIDQPHCGIRWTPGLATDVRSQAPYRLRQLDSIHQLDTTP